MKQIFALFSVFALLICLAMPTTAKASDVGYDIDVGYNVANFTPQAAENICAPSQMLIPTNCDFAENCAAISPNTFVGIGTLREKAPISKYWRGGDTKASLCKAFTFTNICSNTARIYHARYKFGRDIRRLSCESKG